MGERCVRRALETLPEEMRLEYESPVAWVDYAIVVEAHRAIAEQAGISMESMLEAAVPLAVERSFKTVWRVLLRFTTDEALIARTPLLYGKTRSKGVMSARVTSPGVAVAEVEGWTGMPPRDVRALAISIETLLRLAGRKGVRVQGESTPGGARYTVRWRP